MNKKMINYETYGKASDYGTEKIQQELLELLVTFHQECVDQGIKYSLNSGTLLGAIRHKGFIPWDDDADVMMTRENFEKYLILDHSQYGLKTVSHRWVKRIVKLDSSSQACIDIFVVDHAPDNKMVQSMKVLLIRTLQGMMKEPVSLQNYHFPYNLMILVTRIIGKSINQDRKYSLYQKVSQIGNKHKTRYAGIYNNFYKSIPRVYNSDMMDCMIKHSFENTELFITDKYENYLHSVYGDYMTPPRMKDRKAGNFQINCNNATFTVNNSEH